MTVLLQIHGSCQGTPTPRYEPRWLHFSSPSVQASLRGGQRVERVDLGKDPALLLTPTQGHYYCTRAREEQRPQEEGGQLFPSPWDFVPVPEIAHGTGQSMTKGRDLR